jgi:putative tryptophan/tyrosine transport system substrate-binding protein
MDRRESLAALLALGASTAGFAQPARKVSRVGVLVLSSTGSTAKAIQGLRDALRDLGYIEGRSIEFTLHSAEGRIERLPALAAQLAASKVDLVVAGGGNASTLAMMKASPTIPIVMSGSVGAVEAGLIESLARPGRNVTGFTIPRDLGAKQLEVLRELIPSPSRVAIFTRPDPAATQRRAQAKTMAQEFLQMTLEFIEVTGPEEMAPAMARVRASKPGAMLVGPDPLFFQQKEELVEFARSSRIVAIYPIRDFVESGGLLSYSVAAAAAFRTLASYIDRILKGAKPADLPVEEPREYELVVNMKTAKAMGLAIPQSFLVRASEVIQ